MTKNPMLCGVFRVFLKSGGSFDVVCEDVRITRNPLNGVIANVSFVNVDESNPVPLYIETGSIAAIIALRMPARPAEPIPVPATDNPQEVTTDAESESEG